MANTETISLIDSLAASQGVNEEARRKWYERGRVPYKWRLPLSEAARSLGQAIAPEAFDQFRKKNDTAADPAQSTASATTTSLDAGSEIGNEPERAA